LIWLDLLIETGGRALLGVEQWAEIRRMKHVEGLSQREIHRRTGVHRDTIRRALASPEPPSYGPRPARASKLDPFVPMIEELLADEPTLSGVRVREELEKLGYRGGKTILDDLLRELRPRFLPPPRSFERTRYRPGELAQFDLCAPRSEIPVGWARPGADGSSPASCPIRARSLARSFSRRSGRTSPGA
jgi:transposase